MGINELVKWMRANGVTRIKIGVDSPERDVYCEPVDITLDPDWREPVEVEDRAEDTDAEDRRKQAAARRPFRHVRG